VGGDIIANKKTFLMIHALEIAPASQKELLLQLMRENPADKVVQVLRIFKECGVDKWAVELKEKYTHIAFQHLEDIAVMNARKEPLRQLAAFLLQREY
jgi:geranylgeranyl diphosphate synthase type II